MFNGLPSAGLVVLVGAPGSGKSTFSSLGFAEGDVLATDDMRVLVGGTAENLSASVESSALLGQLVDERLRRGIFTVVDSTGTQEGLLDPLERSAVAVGAPVRRICGMPQGQRGRDA